MTSGAHRRDGRSMVVGLVALLLTTSSPLVTALCLIPIGISGSVAMPSITGVVLEGVTAVRAGTASAVFNAFRQVGGAVAIAVLGALIAQPGNMGAGVRTSLGIAAALHLVAAGKQPQDPTCQRRKRGWPAQLEDP